MGTIRRLETLSRPEYLYQTHTIGRAPSCDLVLARRAISGHHAAIRWADGVWTVRDLGSRNGTFLNGRRLTGAPQDLAQGDRLTFANDDETWTLVDAREPRSLLIPLDADDPPLELDRNDVLALPSADEPRWTIFAQRSQWLLEGDGECRVLDDRQELTLGDRRLRVMLVDDSMTATDIVSTPAQRRVEDLTLEIRVSRDEESAAVCVRLGTEVHELPRRTFFYLLAFLARRRLGDAEPRTPRKSRKTPSGWVSVSTACRELGLASPEALGLLVHRCRKAIQSCGLEEPAALVDRSRKGQLRIGVAPDRLSVTCLH